MFFRFVPFLAPFEKICDQNFNTVRPATKQGARSATALYE